MEEGGGEGGGEGGRGRKGGRRGGEDEGRGEEGRKRLYIWLQNRARHTRTSTLGRPTTAELFFGTALNKTSPIQHTHRHTPSPQEHLVYANLSDVGKEGAGEGHSGKEQKTNTYHHRNRQPKVQLTNIGTQDPQLRECWNPRTLLV